MGFSFSKLFSQLHAEEEVRILMVGLDDAGFNVETLEYKNITLKVWGAGDHDRDELRDTALLIFANKAELPSAMASAEISDKLGLFSLAQPQWYITGTCAKSGEGLYEGFQGLCKNIAQRIFSEEQLASNS